MEETEFDQLVAHFGNQYWNEVLVQGRYSTSVDLFDLYAKEAEQEDYKYFQEMCPGLWNAVCNYIGQKLINA